MLNNTTRIIHLLHPGARRECVMMKEEMCKASFFIGISLYFIDGNSP